MGDQNGRQEEGHSPINLMRAVSLAAFATLLLAQAQEVAKAQAQETTASSPSNEATPLEVVIVSTEFKFVPAKVRVVAGRAVTLVLDNSGAETEHSIVFVLPALDIRLEVKAGEIVRKTILFEKAGEYDFICDLPGHSEAGMKGTLIVGDSLAER
jgi:plastocyanin